MNWLRNLVNRLRMPPIEIRNGEPYQAYPAQHGPDFGWILRSRGRQNLTDKQWNACLLDGPWLAESPDDPALDYIRNYRGGLRQPLSTWPEHYLKVYLASHPGA